MWDDFKTSVSLISQLRDPMNTEAWTKFVATYQPGIVACCRRLGCSAQDAEDLSQEVLLKIVKAMPDFQLDPGQRFRGWLYTVVLNAARDFFTRGGKRLGKPIGGTDAHKVLEQVPDRYAEDPLALPGRLADLVSDMEPLRRLLVWNEVLKRVKARLPTPNRWASFEGVYLKDKTPTELAAELCETTAYVGTGARDGLKMAREEADKLRREESGGSSGAV
jgi:RNA polymerase sigma-70 factor (ECF subfamily)